MKMFVVPAGTKGYKIVRNSLVETVTTREICAERGCSREPGAHYVDDPVIAHNQKRIDINATPREYPTVGDTMTSKGYSTISFISAGKEHILFVPFTAVKVV